jgi:hypothetical protein
MTDFETEISEAARAGRLKSITLWRLGDGRWQANSSPDGTAWRVEFAADPADALRKLFDIKPVPADVTGAFD